MWDGTSVCVGRGEWERLQFIYKELAHVLVCTVELSEER